MMCTISPVLPATVAASRKALEGLATSMVTY